MEFQAKKVLCFFAINLGKLQYFTANKEILGLKWQNSRNFTELHLKIGILTLSGAEYMVKAAF